MIISMLTLTGCNESSIANVEIDYGQSDLYTQTDMDEAITLIKKEIKGWRIAKLHHVKYSSDDFNTTDNIAWLNELVKLTI